MHGMGFDGVSIHWFEVIETVSVIGGLLFTAHTIRKDEQARQISNMLAVNEQSVSIWSKLWERPQLSRVLKANADLDKQPVSEEEWVFVKTLLLHLDTVRRAMNAGLFVKIKGLQSDVRFFLSLPIPKTVWQKIKPFQDGDFVAFVESCLKGN
jgi:hypothetical protein